MQQYAQVFGAGRSPLAPAALDGAGLPPPQLHPQQTQQTQPPPSLEGLKAPLPLVGAGAARVLVAPRWRVGEPHAPLLAALQ